jgi:hypothetical protein
MNAIFRLCSRSPNRHRALLLVLGVVGSIVGCKPNQLVVHKTANEAHQIRTDSLGFPVAAGRVASGSDARDGAFHDGGKNIETVPVATYDELGFPVNHSDNGSTPSANSTLLSPHPVAGPSVRIATPYQLRIVEDSDHSGGDQLVEMRLRKSLVRCDHALAVAALEAQKSFARRPGDRDNALALKNRSTALTEVEPDCYTAWVWSAEAAFMLGDQDSFHRALGQMITLGQHQSVKREPWILIHKALLRGWLSPLEIKLHILGEIRRPVQWIVTTGVTSGANCFMVLDFTHASADGTGFAVVGNLQTLYVGGFGDKGPEGFGTMESSNGDLYRGEFQDGIPHGRGTILTHDGGVASGQFYGNWLPDGFALKRDGDGNVYAGRCENGEEHGVGREIAFGAFREGKFDSAGFREGFEFWPDGSPLRFGKFSGAKLDGEGVVRFPNGMTLSGIFTADSATHRSWVTKPSGERFYWCGEDGPKYIYRSDSGNLIDYRH